MGLHLENEVARRVASDHGKVCTYRAPVMYVTKTGTVVLLNKKNTYTAISSVLCIDKLLKPRQSFLITLYMLEDEGTALSRNVGMKLPI